MQRKRIAYGEKVEVALTETERALILEQTFIDTATERLLSLAVSRGTGLVFRMTMEDLDDLLGHVAATANHARTGKLQDQMDGIYDRLKDVEEKYDEDEPCA